MPPSISVIIPVYNVEEYLSICLNSVLNQTMTDYEVLLINDGSTDNSANICEKYAESDQRVKVFHINNSGPSNARNFGLQKAVGKYIIFIDSDDFIDSNAFKFGIQTIMNTNSDLVIFPFYEKKDNVIEKREIKESSFRDPNSKGLFLRKIWLEDEMLASTWNKVYKSDVIKINKLKFEEEFFMAEDYLFNLKYIEAVDSGISVNVPLYYYIRHENSVSSKIIYNKYDIALTVYNESVKLLEKYKIKESVYKNKVQKEYITTLIRAMFDTTRRGYKRSLYKKIREIQKYMIAKETRMIFSESFDFSIFNRFVIFCIRYKQSILYYLAFKLRNTRRGI